MGEISSYAFAHADKVYFGGPGLKPERFARFHGGSSGLARRSQAAAEPTKVLDSARSRGVACCAAIDRSAFLDDFQHHWPTDEDNTYVDFIRDGNFGSGEARAGNPRWRRLAEVRAGGAKSIFHFDVPGQVAKSTHAGLPWLRHLHCALGDQVHFWPFAGWDIPGGVSAIAEVYPSLWNRGFPREGRTPDQHDAYSVAAWLRNVASLNGLSAISSMASKMVLYGSCE